MGIGAISEFVALIVVEIGGHDGMASQGGDFSSKTRGFKRLRAARV
ncbi:hypothetical protein [Burkholderia plantarii]|nr:hypothetical protein [Burkholderia plantarii]